MTKSKQTTCECKPTVRIHSYVMVALTTLAVTAGFCFESHLHSVVDTHVDEFSQHEADFKRHMYEFEKHSMECTPNLH